MTTRVSLIIDENEIGDYRAPRVFQACRHFAQRLAPRCYIMADYVDHARVGWTFHMPTETGAAQLRHYHQSIMARPAH